MPACQIGWAACHHHPSCRVLHRAKVSGPRQVRTGLGKMPRTRQIEQPSCSCNDVRAKGTCKPGSRVQHPTQKWKVWWWWWGRGLDEIVLTKITAHLFHLLWRWGSTYKPPLKTVTTLWNIKRNVNSISRKEINSHWIVRKIYSLVRRSGALLWPQSWGTEAGRSTVQSQRKLYGKTMCQNEINEVYKKKKEAY